MPEVGDHVIFVDMYKKTHNALVTAVHDGGDPKKWPRPCINLVWISDDSTRVDKFGEQIVREASVVHEESSSAKAMCWFESDRICINSKTPSEMLGFKAIGGG